MTSPMPDYMPFPRASLSPALNEQGYCVGQWWPLKRAVVLARARPDCRWVPWNGLTNQVIKCEPNRPRERGSQGPRTEHEGACHEEGAARCRGRGPRRG